jgi:hypothetical protein
MAAAISDGTVVFTRVVGNICRYAPISWFFRIGLVRSGSQGVPPQT